MSQSTRSIEETTWSAIYQSRKVYLGLLLVAYMVQIDLVYSQSGTQDYAISLLMQLSLVFCNREGPPLEAGIQAKYGVINGLDEFTWGGRWFEVYFLNLSDIKSRVVVIFGFGRIYSIEKSL